MLADKKVLALCVTRIHDAIRGDLVDQLNRAALAAGFKLVCFHSTEDFQQDSVYNAGAKAIYDRIDYSVVDGLIVCEDHFHDAEVLEEILSRAGRHKIPAVVLNGEGSEGYQVKGDYEEAFKSLVRHLIRDHGVTDLFFVAGRKKRDPNSERRLALFCEVLEETGIIFDESRLDYGDYREEPAMEIAGRLAKEGKLPQAFVCANDNMAFGLCSRLKELGYRVPEDVIVTGFDGIPATQYISPGLSTCREDRERIASECMKIFTEIFAGGKPEKKRMIPYTRLLSESCGCCRPVDGQKKEDVTALYRILAEVVDYEDYIATKVNQMLNVGSVEGLYRPFSRCLLPGSVLCINSSFRELSAGKAMKEKQSVVIPSCKNGDPDIGILSDERMLPDTEGFSEDDSFYVLTAVYSNDMICGVYAVRANEISGISHKIIKISRYANLVLNSLINQFRQKNMMQSIENAGYMDATTGLPNLKGITRWFENFSSEPENHQKTLAFSIYVLSNYTYIYENYGIHDIEEVSLAIAERLQNSNTKDCCLAKISESEFLAISYYDDPGTVSAATQNAASAFFPQMEEFNHSGCRDYYAEVNMGYTVADRGWAGRLEVFIKYASGELILNRLKKGSTAKAKETILRKDDYSVFNLLVDNNLFVYHFQPIVDAKSGEIYAFEALMRTSGGISFSPVEILDIAKEYNRLDEIEHATLFNVMKRYADDHERFGGRKVFVNTIPNHFLSEAECDELAEKYGEYFDRFVYEVTEQESSSDEEIKAIRRLSGKGGEVQIAVDDYGTGHSNIVNLLRYTPQIIKIDHYLINDIDTDANKQMFVKNTIDFASMNNIKVLAEGVETAEELRTVISFGVDLIQGYYTGRPAPKPVDAIEDWVRDEIIDENVRLARYSNDRKKIYTAKDGETLNLVSLVLEKYSYVHVVSGEVTLQGRKDSTVNIITKVADNAKVKINLLDTNLSGTNEPVFQLGQGSEVEISIKGFNTITKDGIWVMKNAAMRLTGDGALMVSCNKNGGISIGSKFDEPYGKIVFEHTGRVKVISSGDKLVNVGGGSSSSAIEIRSGHLEVTLKESGNEAVGIGTISGNVQITSGGRVNVTSDGEKAVAIGSLKGMSGTVILEAGTVTAVSHCDVGAVLGSLSGRISTVCEDSRLKVYGEGASVTGIGSSMGECTTEIRGGITEVEVLSGNAQPFGNGDDKLIVTGGNLIYLNGDVPVPAVNAYGQTLHRQLREEDVFEQVVHTPGADYIYKAVRCPERNVLSVYLP